MMPGELFSLDKAIYKKYILPMQKPRTDRTGVEFEFPIVNLTGAAADFAVIHEVTDECVEAFGMTVEHRDDSGYVYQASFPANGDGISFDCSYNTFEISFGPEGDLNVIHDRFRKYYTFIQERLRRRGHTLTGMGTNPHWKINRCEPVDEDRYRLIYRHISLGSVRPCPLLPDFDCQRSLQASSASQVQLDAREETVIEALNTFNRLEPWNALLFANSPWDNILCSRDYFWKYSRVGDNPHNVDAYEKPLRDVDDLVRYIRSMSLFYVKRDGRCILFPPTAMDDYFASPVIHGEVYDNGAWLAVELRPEPGDFEWLRPYKFLVLTHRGTIEFRSVCQQPVYQIMAPSAFYTGLMAELPALTQLLAEEAPKLEDGRTIPQLRDLFIRKELPSDFDAGAASEFLLKVLRLAERGLCSRGRGEERFLTPLYERARTLMSPAREMAEGMESGKTLEYYIDAFSRLSR